MKRALVIGAARQGQALARYMTHHGAEVTVTDGKSYDELEAAREALSDIPVRWACGGHPLSLLDECDVLCVTGGADLRISIIQEAFRRNIPVLNDAAIFLSQVKNPIIAITGSSGKTTTTTLVGRIAEAEAKGERKVWVGGNIGLAMLSFIDEIAPEDIVILELSSFQLEIVKNSPYIGAILNITPNHLDRHETMENYTAAKMNILTHQGSSDTAVLFRENPLCWDQRKKRNGSLFSFGFEKPETDEAEGAVWLENDTIKLKKNGETQSVMRVDEISLRGRHNVCNVMAACAIAAAAGFTAESMRAGVIGFGGVEHRLQFVRNYHGANWYNDSIATAPERTMAALHSFTEPLIMLLGGRDKKLPWGDLAEALQTRARAVVLFGEAAPMIREALADAQKENGPIVIQCGTLEEAVAEAGKICQTGDVVLLSPGGTSYDAFVNFEERGKKFTEWVLNLQ